MAKKKRRIPKEKEEVYEFVPPEFDEKEFLIKDIQVTKISWMVIFMSIIMGLVAYFFTDVVGSMAVGFLVLMVSILGLKQFLSILRFDVSEMDSKGMLGNYLLFTLLFLGVWIICMNPPIGDHANPIIADLSIGYEAADGYEFATLNQNVYSLLGSYNLSEPGKVSVNITAMVADNGKLVEVSIFWQNDGETYNMTSLGGDMYGFSKDVPAPSALDTNPVNSRFSIRATDDAGNVMDTGTLVIRVPNL